MKLSCKFGRGIRQCDLNVYSLFSGSQEERVGILKMALLHKGVSSHSAHYDTAPRDSDMGTGHQGSWALPNDIDHSSTQTAADEGGIDL